MTSWQDDKEQLRWLMDKLEENEKQLRINLRKMAGLRERYEEIRKKVKWIVKRYKKKW